MIVNMSEKATEQEITHVIERIREAGYQPHVTRGVERTIVAAVGSGRRHEIEALQAAPGVETVVAIAQPFKLVSRQVRPERSVVEINGVRIGGPEVVVIAGPCSLGNADFACGSTLSGWVGMPSACSTLPATMDQRWTNETKLYKKQKKALLAVSKSCNSTQ